VSGRALAVERFDRKDGDNRTHMEELAQVLEVPTARLDAKYKYANFETVAIFVAALAGIDNVGEVIDRLVLNVLVGNGDAHLKNWAFTYPDGRLPTLSPVYDVVPTVLYLPGDDLGMNLDRNKNFAEVTAASFATAGTRSGYGAENARKRAGAAVERIVDRWPLLADFLPHKSFRVLTDRLGQLGLTRVKS
jgi:serine/threonine-protein kinase HipA